MEGIKKKGKMIYSILGLALIFELFMLFYNSGVASGINKRADNLKTYAIATRDNATISPGDIYDRNGNILVQTENATVYSDGKAYSQLLGYTGERQLNPQADSKEEIVGDRTGYRLMAFLDDEYWGENGLYSTVNLDGTKGQSATLTIDDALQREVYVRLSEQMSESDDRGSVVVLDAKTGEILSMVAFPTYDFNNLSSAVSEMTKDEQETELEPGFPITYKDSEAPGSIFKVLTAVSLIDHDMEKMKVEDASFVVDGWQCNNDYGYTGDKIDYEEALRRSSNVFFAQAALTLGEENLRETAEKFMLFEDSKTLSLDFGDVLYNWDLSGSQSILAQTGFGQGKTELSTIYAAMITQAIANDGVMMKPYLIKSLTTENEKVVYKGESEVLSKATSKSTANKVTKAMVQAVTSAHGSYLDSAVESFEKYEVAGKTGTAQTGDANGTNNAWFISFAPADNPQYVVVVNQCKTDKYGSRMMTTASDIYKYLFEEYK